MNFKKLSLLLVAIMLMAFMAGCGTGGQDAGQDENTIKIGWVYIGIPGDAGWTYSHDQGRQFIDTAIQGVTIEHKILEAVPEGADAERSIEQLAQEGCQIIIANSFGYGDAVLEVAKRYPDIKFMHCSGLTTADNVSTFFGRIYQARYLSGMAAGAMTESNKIGYVAAYPIPEVIRGINAFTLGAQAVNPDVEVQVVWTQTWYNPTQERQAAQSMLDAGCDVIAQHQDTPGPQQAAEDAGKFAVGYHSDMRAFAPNANLTSAIWNWGPYYVNVVNSVLDGTWKSEAYWEGLDAGIVDLAPISDKVPQEVRTLIAERKQQMTDKEWDVFVGPIKDNKGNVKVEEGQSLTDEEMLSMDWFVAGVRE